VTSTVRNHSFTFLGVNALIEGLKSNIKSGLVEDSHELRDLTYGSNESRPYVMSTFC